MQNPQSLVMNDQDINNQWVVPHNRDLYAQCDTHMNVVHLVACIVVKYLYRYIHKGHDCATNFIEGSTMHHDIDQT